MNTKTSFVALTIIALAMPASAASLRFDFGRTDTQMPFGTGWNNVVPATTTLFTTFDADDNPLPIGFEITDDFYNAGEPSHLGSFVPTGDAAALFPPDATSDFFFGHVGTFAGQPENPLGQFKLMGLDPSMTYDFTFFASRQPISDLRETQFTAHGANSASGVLEPANNDSEILILTGVIPDGNNEIFVDVEVGPGNTNSTGFYYLNAMQVDIIPEPTSLLLMLPLLSLLRRR